MQRPLITTPPEFLRYVSVDWDIDWREQSAGTTVAGRRNVAINKLPRWVGSPTLEFFRRDIGTWRAQRLAGRGMTGIYRIVMRDSAVYATPCGGEIPFEDGTLFADGTGFESDYAVRCDAGASAGDTEIVVDMDSANGPIDQGQILSHGDWPFCVVAIDGGTLRIEMPLRRAIPAGDLIRLNGRGLFEMVEARTGNPVYNNTLVSRPEVMLQEWLR